MRIESLLVGLLLTASACPARADVVQMSADTFLASRTSKAGIFTNMPKLKIAVIREANAFAERLGKIAVPISSREVPASPAAFAYVEYQFRVVAKDGQGASGGALLPRPDLVVDQHTTTDVHTTDDAKPDLYTELTKLDDLRKRGVLTEAEFAEQKKKLLDK